MSDTPRTDAASFDTFLKSGQMALKRVVDADFARTLERIIRDCPLLHTTTCNVAEKAWIARAKAAIDSAPTSE